MNVKEFKTKAKDREELNFAADEMMRLNLLPEIEKKYECTEAQAKYMVIEALHYNLVWDKVLEAIVYGDVKGLIYVEESEPDAEIEDIPMKTDVDLETLKDHGWKEEGRGFYKEVGIDTWLYDLEENHFAMLNEHKTEGVYFVDATLEELEKIEIGAYGY